MATKKVTAALLTLNEAINGGVEYPAAHEKACAIHNLTVAQAEQLADAYDTQEAAFAKSNPDRDPNDRYKVLTMELGAKGTESHTRINVYLLNVGEHFERFGGSSRGLTVTKKASLIVRTVSCGSSSDREYDLHGKGRLRNMDTWAWLKRCIIREAGVTLPDEE
jgi:hypothetical protein